MEQIDRIIFRKEKKYLEDLNSQWELRGLKLGKFWGWGVEKRKA